MLACRWSPNSCSESVSAGIVSRRRATLCPRALGRSTARRSGAGASASVTIDAVGVRSELRIATVRSCVERRERPWVSRAEQVEAEQHVDACRVGAELAADRRGRDAQVGDHGAALLGETGLIEPGRVTAFEMCAAICRIAAAVTTPVPPTPGIRIRTASSTRRSGFGRSLGAGGRDAVGPRSRARVGLGGRRAGTTGNRP